MSVAGIVQSSGESAVVSAATVTAYTRDAYSGLAHLFFFLKSTDSSIEKKLMTLYVSPNLKRYWKSFSDSKLYLKYK